MTTTAWIFPGQGSQKVGMVADLTSQPAAQEKLAAAEEILGWSVLDACVDEAKLSDTRYTQPCLYIVEALLVDAMRERGTADFVAGHSLGEYVALYGAQVFDFASGLQLVKQRAELMAATEGGKMIAMMGFEREALEAAIAANPDVVLANDNSSGQVVISGTPAAVDAIAASVKSKRAVPLAVSGAFHSPLMNPAAANFQTALDGVTFQTAQIPVFSNVDPTPATAADVLKTRLSQQMTGSVRWREIMAALVAKQVETVVEIGPGNVLTGLFKREYREINRVNVSAIANLP
ncbi:ACP S-malonyltransferase [Spirulina major CS-329]|uniref:ACP S-malonyltransferase n=1 Tax=Spirulina TaxID=1154 RepID=UPI00232DA157|nr:MULTISPECIES: ACP S-malonyltransferase [Spirulina]MDB9496215.1 ACP S-malonyltransferase [Spirulina subsalsa CS-330]MDB9504261.1 ACP S-malonyltransferase [Spirulina major CS-329]